MKNPVQNVRLGQATNSSSSHSIILLKKDDKTKYKDKDTDDFGWNYFTAASKEEKLKYISILIKRSLVSRTNLPDNHAALIAATYTAIAVDEITEGSIDHQSVMIIPYKAYSEEYFNSLEIEKEYIDDLLEFIKREDVLILGGNDNDEDDHPLAIRGTAWLEEIPRDTNAVYYARKDASKKWTLYCPENGLKVRVDFNTDISVPTLIPDLVDMKITDYCSFGCTYCYMGSTTDGKHGDLDVITGLIERLFDKGVFEIALGGGEPTQHPYFEKILSTARAYKYNSLNFTTRNPGFIVKNTELLERIPNTHIAFSVDNGKETKSYLEFVKRLGFNMDRIKIQYVPGLKDSYTLQNITEICANYGVGLTLLGGKDTYRGKTLVKNVDKFRELEKKVIIDSKIFETFMGRINISVDTVLAENLVSYLKERHISDRLYETKDGIRSCFVDAVDLGVYTNSYGGVGTKISIPKNLTGYGLRDYTKNEVIPRILKGFSENKSSLTI